MIFYDFNMTSKYGYFHEIGIMSLNIILNLNFMLPSDIVFYILRDNNIYKCYIYIYIYISII